MKSILTFVYKFVFKKLLAIALYVGYFLSNFKVNISIGRHLEKKIKNRLLFFSVTNCTYVSSPPKFNLIWSFVLLWIDKYNGSRYSVNWGFFNEWMHVLGLFLSQKQSPKLSDKSYIIFENKYYDTDLVFSSKAAKLNGRPFTQSRYWSLNILLFCLDATEFVFSLCYSVSLKLKKYFW